MTGGNTSTHSILMGEYTLGLLSANETVQAHALLGQDQQAVATALAWENSLLELTDLLAPVDPSPLLLQRIQSILDHDTTPPPASLYRQPANDARPTSTPAASATAASAAPGMASQDRAATSRIEPVAPVEPINQALEADGQTGAGLGRPVRPQAAAAPAANASSADATSFTIGATTTDRPATGTPVTGLSAADAAASITASGAGTIQADPAVRFGGPQARARGQKKPGNIWFWRMASLVFALIALALALIPTEPAPPPITVLQVAPTQAAILQAPGQSSTPGWVVTVDPQRNIVMNPKVRSDIPADASVQLWTHNSGMPAPRSLGLIDPNQPVTVPAALIGDIALDQIFEMTLEPEGGSPIASPSGPVLFIGRIVTFGAPARVDDTAPGASASRPPH